MAIPAYISITGEKQGLITREAFTVPSMGSTQDDLKDTAIVQAVSHEMEIPYNPQNGEPTGLRVHHPICITKVFDKSSPLLLQALSSNELLTKVEIKWYRPKGSALEHYYTTTLERALIVKIRDYMHNCQDPDNAHYSHLQDVYMTYGKISWSHKASSTEGSDDWEKLKKD